MASLVTVPANSEWKTWNRRALSDSDGDRGLQQGMIESTYRLKTAVIFITIFIDSPYSRGIIYTIWSILVLTQSNHS
jgi:hypothetical protein